MESKHRATAYALGLAAALASVTYGGLPAAATSGTPGRPSGSAVSS
ncbi:MULTISPECIES: hypothetical protein [unclassified Micromonospora]